MAPFGFIQHNTFPSKKPEGNERIVQLVSEIASIYI